MNASLQRLLNTLADGEVHSGESLGELLGVSRAAVWKQLQQLQALGVELKSVKGSGYCVEGGLDLLQRETILDACNLLAVEDSAFPLRDLSVHTSLDSTSQALIRLSAEGKSIHGLACFAEKQTAGRGRRGRIWQSPFASNLYFSIGWRIQGGVAAVEGLSLAVGVVLCETLESVGIEGVQLKWPNDLLFDGKKLGGILLEINGDAAGDCDLVLGIGLNVRMSRESGLDIDQAWTDLHEIKHLQALPVLPNRSQLAARLLFHLLTLLAKYEQAGFSAWREAWLQRNAHQNKNIELLMGAKKIQGRMQGVNETGALLLDTGNSIETFIGGEISVRVQS